MNTFAEKLKSLRLEKGLSSISLGKILNVSGSTIIRWEHGSMLPSIEQLYKIAVYFSVSTDYLVGLEI